MSQRIKPATEAPGHDGLQDWPLRPWLYALIGGGAGLAVHLLFNGGAGSRAGSAIAAFAFFAALGLGFTLRPDRPRDSIIFSLGLGTVMAGIAFLAIDAGDRLAGEEFGFAAGVFFSLLAIPLFQSDFHRRRWATPYRETHFHVWTDAVSAGGALAFMLLSFALIWLLDALFILVGIELIGQLFRTDWFAGLFLGATFGAGLGVLRNQLAIIGTLQRVVMLVLSLLAVPFAAAILVFVVMLVFSGGDALWNATDSATPVLLACAIGCFVLVNVVVRDDDDSRSGNVVMQAAALVLAAAIFPLTVFAAVSMGIRIGQHGLSPERLWALVAIAIATAYGLAYWVAMARGRLAGWAHHLRRANLHLAAGSCLVALVLAFPWLDFGRISAKNQLARLDRGEVSVADFDFEALRWDFGEAGRRALARIAAGEGEAAQLAAEVQARAERYPVTDRRRSFDPGALALSFEDARLRGWVRSHVAANPWQCSPACVAIDLGQEGDRRRVALVSARSRELVAFRDDGLADLPAPVPAPPTPDTAIAPGDVEVRSFEGRQIFVNGRPVGEPFE
ncbi:DUF4153 domain-containing protein [Erythrobacter arachoides]|uniref:DUF4153 domain-containing protein n=1 Tax=Aurantiacibacter arachoides TaxID=1850444 RepID=A0A844ZWY9_9SPHN|nr:DUF4153 domain-containing protein [Aurantiacibacter arachoides]MXO92405.1 DUF4153 domain-containing protein [Aurantiacibacter arachoides]GGD57426.1 hypothetical protein GCM10011411_16840 [Aurantiacibacter arachoides]